ncbi:MAG: hypothetical protein ACJ787_17130 [Myxococcales bacterium]
MKRVVGIALLFCAACTTLPFPEPELVGPYGRELGKWTRKTALYAGLETRAFCRVVYLSYDMIEAQSRYISDLRTELPDEAERTRERLHKETATPTLFAVLFTPDKTANDWDAKDSVWRLAINFGFGQVEPKRVERLERPFNPELRALYPYLDDYSVAYVIHFPAQEAPEGLHFTPTELTMIASGAPGKMEFKWDLKALTASR